MRYPKRIDTTTQSAYCPECRKRTVLLDNKISSHKREFWVKAPINDKVKGGIPADQLFCSDECRIAGVEKIHFMNITYAGLDETLTPFLITAYRKMASLHMTAAEKAAEGL